MPAPIICDKCQEFLNKPARLFISEEEFKNSRHYGGSDVLIGDAYANIAVWIGKNNVGRSKSSWWYCSPVHPNCLSSDTKIFTREKGFIYFSELQGDETLLSLNPVTKFIENVKYTEIIKYRHNGDMIRIKGRAYDSLMTPDHKLFYEKRRSTSKGKFYTKHFGEAKSFINDNEVRLPRCPEGWISEDDSIGVDEYNDKLYKAKLLGWILSEGYLYSTGIGIAQQKEKNFDRIENIIKFLNLGYTKARRGFYLRACDYTKDLIKQGCVVHQHIRRVPDWIKNSSKEIINAFIDEYVAGDGSTRKTKIQGYDSKEVVIFTSSVLMRDDLIECLLKTGRSANITISAEKGKVFHHHNGDYTTNHTVWRLQVSESKNIRLEVLESSYEQYNDYVYCVTLPKNNIFLIERNGKVMWTGNCSHIYEEFTPKMKSIYSQDEDELDEIFGEGMEEFTHNQMKNTHNDKGEQFWTSQKSSLVLWHEDDCSCHADEEIDPGEWVESYLSI